MCGSVWFYFPFIPSLTDTTNLYSIFVQKMHCIGIVSLGKMNNINNRNTHDITLNCMNKSESWSSFIHYEKCASVKLGFYYISEPPERTHR